MILLLILTNDVELILTQTILTFLSILVNLSNDEETLLNNKLHLLGTFESTEDGSLIANQETQSVSDLTNTISQLKQQKGDIKTEKRLNEYCEELTSTKKLYQEQLEANGNLIEQWNSRYWDQGKRVKAVIDIARLNYTKTLNP